MMAEVGEFSGHALSGCICTNYMGTDLGGPMHKPKHQYAFNYALKLLTLTTVWFWLMPSSISLNDTCLGSAWHLCMPGCHPAGSLLGRGKGSKNV